MKNSLNQKKSTEKSVLRKLNVAFSVLISALFLNIATGQDANAQKIKNFVRVNFTDEEKELYENKMGNLRKSAEERIKSLKDSLINSIYQNPSDIEMITKYENDILELKKEIEDLEKKGDPEGLLSASNKRIILKIIERNSIEIEQIQKSREELINTTFDNGLNPEQKKINNELENTEYEMMEKLKNNDTYDIINTKHGTKTPVVNGKLLKTENYYKKNKKVPKKGRPLDNYFYSRTR